MTRSQRVADAIRLREAGMPVRAIADRLGVHPKTAYEWLEDPDGSQRRARRRRYAGVCVDCGHPTDGSSGYGKAARRCAHCAPAATVVWSRDAIIAAIRTWAQLHDGDPPAAEQWRRSTATAHPSTSTVATSFGSWSAAIRAAGFTPRRAGERRPAVFP